MLAAEAQAEEDRRAAAEAAIAIDLSAVTIRDRKIVAGIQTQLEVSSCCVATTTESESWQRKMCSTPCDALSSWAGSAAALLQCCCILASMNSDTAPSRTATQGKAAHGSGRC